MRSQIQISHHKSQVFKAFGFEFNSPWKKSQTLSSEKCCCSQKLTHDGTNFTKNKFQNINQLQEKKLNFTEPGSAVQRSFQEVSHESPEKNKETRKKITIEKLIQKYRSCKQELYKCKKQVQTLKNEKVEYEEIVYNLQTENTDLSSMLQKTRSQYHNLKEIDNRRKERNLFMSNVIDILFIGNDGGIINLSNQNQTQKLSNNGDLQLIIDEMRRKTISYEKEITEKQILNNHQFYLLERFKKQRNELKLTQTELVNELKFVIAKNKKLKRENDEIMNENEERIRQIINLEQANSKLLSDNAQLLSRVSNLSLSPPVFPNMQNEQIRCGLSYHFTENVSSKNLIDNLNQICSVLDRKQRVNGFEIFKCVNIKIDEIILSKIEVKENGVSCVEDFRDQMKLRDQRIKELERELKQVEDFQQDMLMHMQYTQSKLLQLATDLNNLHLQYQTLKQQLDQQRTQSSPRIIKTDNLVKISSFCCHQKQPNIQKTNLSQQFISDYQLSVPLTQFHSSTLFCFNDKIQL